MVFKKLYPDNNRSFTVNKFLMIYYSANFSIFVYYQYMGL